MASLFQRSRWFVVIISMTLGSLLYPVVAAAEAMKDGSADDPELDQVALLKRFVSTPPIVKSLTFERKVPVVRTNEIQPTHSETLTERYFGRWQPGSVFLRQVSDSSELNSHSLGGVLVATHAGDYWLMTTNSKFADHWIEPSEGKWRNSYIRSEVEFQSRLLSEAINFGVMYAAPGSIVWSGDRFTAEGEIPLLAINVTIEGRLQQSGGVAKGFHIVYRYPTTLVEHRVAFGYENSPEDWRLPSQITVYWTDGKHERQLCSISIKNIERSVTNLPPALFEVQQFILKNRKEVRLLDGTNRFEVMADGQKRFLDSVTPQRKPQAPAVQTSAPLFTYLVWAGLNLGIVRLSLKLNKKPK